MDPIREPLSSPLTSPISFTAPADSTTSGFYAQAVDNAGNITPYSPTVQATYVAPDLTPPTTAVSNITLATNVFTVTFSGSDSAGGSGLKQIQLFVQKDGGTAISLGVFPSTNNQVQTYNYHVVRDGSHTYKFYTQGTDNANNVETPGPGMSYTSNLPIPSATLSVQNGAVQRSFINTISYTLDSTLAMQLYNNQSRIAITQYGLDGVTFTRTVTNYTVALGAVSGGNTTLIITFTGADGIGGTGSLTATSKTGDGIYQVNLDLDGDTLNVLKSRFYRLLGDVNGDLSVDQTDFTLVSNNRQSLGFAYNSQYDVNGDGSVNNTDVSIVTSEKGRKITGSLTTFA